MKNIPSLLQHSRKWDDNNNFITIHVDTILIMLEKDNRTIVIQFVIAQRYQPIIIFSDMNISVYMELKHG